LTPFSDRCNANAVKGLMIQLDLPKSFPS